MSGLAFAWKKDTVRSREILLVSNKIGGAHLSWFLLINDSLFHVLFRRLDIVLGVVDVVLNLIDCFLLLMQEYKHTFESNILVQVDTKGSHIHDHINQELWNIYFTVTVLERFFYQSSEAHLGFNKSGDVQEHIVELLDTLLQPNDILMSSFDFI